MADSTYVALKGIVARLRGFSALTSLVTSTNIVSSVTQQTAFPYVLVEMSSTPWVQDDGSHMQHTIRTHAYSDNLSPNDSILMGQEIYNALDRQESNIVLDSGNVLLCVFSGLKTTFKETDGNIWHSVTEFELIID